MKAIKFKGHNTELKPPPRTKEGQIETLFVYRDGVSCHSAWKASFLDRIKILFTGKIWLSVMSGRTQYPVRIQTAKPFKNVSK